MSKRFIAIAVILFCVTATYTLPAKLLVSAVGVSNAGVYLQGASGYWHDGRAQTLHIALPDYAVQLQNVAWDLSFSKLLLGQLSADLTARFAGRDARATVSRSLFGTTAVADLSMMIDFDDIRPLMNNLIVPLNGRVELRDVSLAYDGSWISKASGIARISQLSASVPLGELAIGNFDLVMAQDNATSAPLRAEIANYAGAFGLTGDAQLQADRSYELGLISEPDGTVQAIVLQQMGMIFGPPTQGQYAFEYAAKL